MKRFLISFLFLIYCFNHLLAQNILPNSKYKGILCTVSVVVEKNASLVEPYVCKITVPSYSNYPTPVAYHVSGPFAPVLTNYDENTMDMLLEQDMLHLQASKHETAEYFLDFCVFKNLYEYGNGTVGMDTKMELVEWYSMRLLLTRDW